MYLYKLTQTEVCGYDTYDSCIVAANSVEEAKQINPNGYWQTENRYLSWPFPPDPVSVEFIGLADPEIKEGVILASFNPGW